MIKLPDVIGMTLCERVDFDPAATRYSLVGVFHNRHYSHFPAKAEKFSVYLALYDGVGQGRIELVINQLKRERDIFFYEKWLAFPERLKMIHLELSVRKCVF